MHVVVIVQTDNEPRGFFSFCVLVKVTRDQAHRVAQCILR